MKWIWEHKNWPSFTYDKAAFDAFEKEFHRNTGVIVGALQGIASTEQEELRITILSEEALDTSKIEGEFLNRESVQSSVRKNLGLQTDGRRAKPQEAGISQMLVDLFKNYDSPLSHETLFRWHAMTLNGRTDIEIIGSYRQHTAPCKLYRDDSIRPQYFTKHRHQHWLKVR